MTEPERIKLPMACYHGEGREEDFDRRRHAILDSWSTSYFKATPEKFVTAMIYVLGAYPHGWQIEAVHVDQWMRIIVEGKKNLNWDTREWAEHIRISVECDRFEDGLVALYEYINEHYPDDEDN